MTPQQQISRAIEIENGLDFIINHFDPTILYFPRKVMTDISKGQKIVYAKDEALKDFQQSEFLDCRINAFRYSSNSAEKWNPDLIFIDIDRNDNFKDYKSLELALSNTLKNIKEKLNGNPTVLFTGGGFHIYQPIEGVLFENYAFFEFNRQYDLFKEFLRFSKKFLSNNKADKNNTPSLKSCLLRIPGSINSKYNNKVKIVQKWNGYRPQLSEELLEDFRTYLIQKKIEEHNYKQKMLIANKKMYKKNQYSYSNRTNNNYYEWIETILQTPFEDCRKIISSLILAPYLINVKKLPFQECFQIIKEWLDKCNSLEKLDNVGSFSSRISYSIKNAQYKQIGPMSQYKIKTDSNYRKLYILLKKK